MNEQRPPVWVGHVVMPTTQLRASTAFMKKIGMRSIFEGDSVSVLELRGGTHLVLQPARSVRGSRSSFDLMVDDFEELHRTIKSWDMKPTPITPGGIHDSFEVKDPGGVVVRFSSSHVVGEV